MFEIESVWVVVVGDSGVQTNFGVKTNSADLILLSPGGANNGPVSHGTTHIINWSQHRKLG